MPILKGEASHYDSDLHNLLFCCQCADVAFYSEDSSKVVEAHKVILCSVSHVFMLLFDVKSPADIHDPSILRTAQSLFAVEAGAGLPTPHGVPPCSVPIRVVVKDSVFCSCLPDILHFIYSGTLWEWPIYSVLLLQQISCSGAQALTEEVCSSCHCVMSYCGTYFIPRDY